MLVVWRKDGRGDGANGTVASVMSQGNVTSYSRAPVTSSKGTFSSTGESTVICGVTVCAGDSLLHFDVIESNCIISPGVGDGQGL